MTQKNQKSLHTPTIVPFDTHGISLDKICGNALKVVQRLDETDHQAYLVGGCVRDLLLQREPKDFDVATSASPDDARQLFRNGRLIGRRFRLLHVRFGRNIIEVATFRAGHETAQNHDEGHIRDGMILRDNVFGTMEEDAWRRDFTINALYLNVRNLTVVDYTNGMADVRDGLIRIIGDAQQRYQEDPVRMLRAVRFAAKLGFRIEAQTEAPIFAVGDRLAAVPAARLYEELLKLFVSGHGEASFHQLLHYDLLQYLLPLTARALNSEHFIFEALIVQGLKNTDDRIAANKPVTPAFLFAIMLWKPMLDLSVRYLAEGQTPQLAIQIAGGEVFNRQCDVVSIPKRFSLQSREIWALQDRLQRRHGNRSLSLLEHPRFRAAYDFLLLRHQAGEEGLGELCQWWTEFQEVDETKRAAMARLLSPATKRRRKRGKKRKKPAE